MFFGHGDGFTRAGIAACAGLAVAYGKGAKAAEFDARTAFQRLRHGLQNNRHHTFHVTPRQMRIFLMECVDKL